MTLDIHSKYYVTKSDIQKLLECGYEKSKKIFDAAREAELNSGLILAHDNSIALAIAESLVDIFSLKRKEIIPEDDYFYVQTGAYKSLIEAE